MTGALRNKQLFIASPTAKALPGDGSIFQPGNFGQSHHTGAGRSAPSLTQPRSCATEASPLFPGLPRSSKINNTDWLFHGACCVAQLRASGFHLSGTPQTEVLHTG